MSDPRFLPIPVGALTLPLDCDYVLLIPVNHHLAAKDGEKITVRIQTDRFLDKDSDGVFFSPRELSDQIESKNLAAEEKPCPVDK